GQVLSVNRVENKTVKDKQSIEAEVETKKSDALYEGETKVETEGKDGAKQDVDKVKTITGAEVKKEQKDEKVLSEPETREGLRSGHVRRVTGVENKTGRDRRSLGAGVETKKCDSLYEGETKVETEGKDGAKQVVYNVKTISGEEVKKEKKDEKVLSEPETKVVL